VLAGFTRIFPRLLGYQLLYSARSKAPQQSLATPKALTEATA
jgi:hypothetical protein